MSKKGNAPKRVPKNKEELRAEMARIEKIERQKVLARLIFPHIADQKTIYDAQTVVQALAGFIKQELALKASNIIVKELPVDFSNEKDSPIKKAMVDLIVLLQTEKADDCVALLERFGSGLGQFSASKYMENPMSSVNVDDFVA
jgi:hypothetical protein